MNARTLIPVAEKDLEPVEVGQVWRFKPDMDGTYQVKLALPGEPEDVSPDYRAVRPGVAIVTPKGAWKMERVSDGKEKWMDDEGRMEGAWVRVKVREVLS